MDRSSIASRMVSGVAHRRHLPSIIVMALLAACACCGLMVQSSLGRDTVVLQEAVPSSLKGLSMGIAPSILVAAQRAFAKGFMDGESEENLAHSFQMERSSTNEDRLDPAMAKLGESNNKQAVSTWINRWENQGAENSRQQALARLFMKAEGESTPSNDEIERGQSSHLTEQPRWQDFAFQPANVPFRSPIYSLLASNDETSNRLAEAQEKQDEQAKHLNAKEIKQEEAHKALEEYYAQQAARDHVAESHHENEHERSLEEYYADMKKRDVVPKSHLAVPEDPKQFANWQHAATQAYFEHPDALYKMFYAAEHHDMKAALQEYKKIYFKQTQKEGALYPPHELSKEEEEKEGTVDASKDGDASS